MISYFQEGSPQPEQLTAGKLLAMLEGTDSRTIVAVAANSAALAVLRKNYTKPELFNMIMAPDPVWIIDDRLPAGKCAMIYTHEALDQYVKDLEAGKPLQF